MRLLIEHAVDVVPSDPAAQSVHYVRLTPRHDPCQKILRWSLMAPGGSSEWTDAYGNAVHSVVCPQGASVLSFRVNGEVDTADTHGVLPAEIGGMAPEVFLRTTPLTAADETVRAFAAGPGVLRAKGSLGALHALMGEINDAVAALPADTAPHASPAETLAAGAGLCQDHAHLFIACCRSWGVPARYVSGYLHAVDDDGLAVATHGWAEALVEDLGWVSFDPVNRLCATQGYVRLAIGMDGTEAAPVRGTQAQGAREELNMRVRVSQAHQSQQ